MYFVCFTRERLPFPTALSVWKVTDYRSELILNCNLIQKLNIFNCSAIIIELMANRYQRPDKMPTFDGRWHHDPLLLQTTAVIVSNMSRLKDTFKNKVVNRYCG